MKKISALNALLGSALAAADLFVVNDTSATETKKITYEELIAAITEDIVIPSFSVAKGTITFDLTTAAGAQTVTGAGFTPKVLIALISTGVTVSVGFASAAGGYCAGAGDFVIGYDAGSYSAYFGSVNDGSYSNRFGHFALTSFGADGFTYAYSKTGVPTGNATFAYLLLG